MKNKNYKVVLVTGGAKRVGASICKQLAKKGYKVIIHYNNSKREAKKLETEINSKEIYAATVQGDLSIENDVENLFSEALQKFGTIDCLINNASVFEYDNLSKIKKQSWENHILPNLRAPIILSKLFAAKLPKKVRGNIINIIDQRVLNLTPHFLSYTLSKSGLWTLTRTLALELAPRIRVNAIGPGPVLKSKFQSRTEFRNQCKSMPLEIGTSPEEICETIFYILSVKALTGQIIALDGGQHLGWGQVKKSDELMD